jgi:uncharacterized protein involved in copper resistance
MKFQKLINLLVGSVLLSFVLTGATTAQQLLAQQKQPSPQKGEMKSMEHMSMDQMMKDCMQHHQSMTKSIDETSNTIEGAKQSNDPAKMRAALDQAQKQLTNMKEHMSMCSNMMGIMEKMQGMGGMKDSSK